MSALATVEASNPKRAPTLTPGKITPELLHQWERACKEFFRIKNIADDKKVESVLSRLQDQGIADWAEANEAMLKDLEFPEFMKRVRKQALEHDWDRKVMLTIIESRQGTRAFYDWANGLYNRNTLLRGTEFHMDEKGLRQTIENTMNQVLEYRMRRFNVPRDTPIRDWIEQTRMEDEFMTKERELANELSKQRELKSKNVASGRTMGTRIENTAPTQRPSGSTSLPRLTNVERSIIFEHQGCFKCRRLYVDHKGANCPNGFPAPGTYKPLTAEYAESVRDSKNKPKSRSGPAVVAYVGYPTVEDTAGGPSAVLGVGEEDSDDSDMRYASANDSPFSVGHLGWRCRVNGPSVPEPITITARLTTALIQF